MIRTLRLPKILLIVAVSHFSLLDASAQSLSQVVRGKFACEAEIWGQCDNIDLETVDTPVTVNKTLGRYQRVCLKLNLANTLESTRSDSAIRIVFEYAPKDSTNYEFIETTVHHNCEDSGVYKSDRPGEVILSRGEGYANSFQLELSSDYSIDVVVKVTAKFLSNTLIAAPPQTMAYSQPAAIAPAFTAAGGVCYPANAPWCRRAGRRGLVRYRR
jgi:hypothetical protein